MARASLRGGLLAAFISVSLVAQVPSVQLTLKEKSGFLGMGGPRVVTIQLSTSKGDTVVTSDDVNAGPYYYFLITPAGGWSLDADIVAENLAQLTIYQNSVKHAIVWKGDIIAGPPTSIVLGFPKEVKLNQLFLFQVPMDDKTQQAEMSVPQEYWPGYTFMRAHVQAAMAAVNTGDMKGAIGHAEQVLGDPSLQIFPQYDDLKRMRTKSFMTYLDGVASQFQQTVSDTGNLKGKIARVEGFKPLYQYVVDSLPRAAWNLGSLDPSIAPIVDRARNGVATVQSTRDSLQRELDDRNVRWIITGSAMGKNGFLFQYMIETLSWAFSSMNFRDTVATVPFQITLPEELTARLERYALTESYDTFLRMCAERAETNLPIFPVEFLPNLRKDTASFVQPYYDILKAVNDYYYGNLNGAREAIGRILLTCTESELNARFDQMRIIIEIRRGHAPAEVLRVLEEAEQMEKKGDSQGALERYRQATILAPNFAYAFFAFGQYYVRTGDPIRAINFFQRAYQVDSLYTSAYREAYNLYLKQGNYKPIIDVLVYALDHGNDTWEVNSALGTAYLGDNDPAKAIQHFERALALNGKSYRTNIQLGLAHQAVKNYQRAREYFNNAIGLDPTRQDAVDYLTRLNELQRNER